MTSLQVHGSTRGCGATDVTLSILTMSGRHDVAMLRGTLRERAAAAREHAAAGAAAMQRGAGLDLAGAALKSADAAATIARIAERGVVTVEVAECPFEGEVDVTVTPQPDRRVLEEWTCPLCGCRYSASFHISDYDEH